MYQKAVLFFMLHLSAVSLISGEKMIGMRFPSLGPAGKGLVFCDMGDLLRVDAGDGHACRLTDHEAYDREPLWSPDGQWIVFTPNRYGDNDVFLIPSRGGRAQTADFSYRGRSCHRLESGRPLDHYDFVRFSSSGLFKIQLDGENPIPLPDT